MKPENKILYDDTNAAKLVENIKGWVDINGFFFGNMPDSEHRARYSSCTHLKCACGELMQKGWVKCEKCRKKDSIEKYNTLLFREYNGEIVYSHLADEYFCDEDAIIDYCEDNEIQPESLRLVFCKPLHFTEIDGSIWDDALPEDSEELPEKLIEAINALNATIKTLPPASYIPSDIRTQYMPSKE